MEVKNCKGCGKLFNYFAGGPKVCPACVQKLEDDFQKVKEYIRNNKCTDINTVAEECEVTVNQIKQWVREERLVFDKDSGIALECETCGAPISTGRFCQACKNKVATGFAQSGRKVVKEEPKKVIKDKERMRFLDK